MVSPAELPAQRYATKCDGLNQSSGAEVGMGMGREWLIFMLPSEKVGSLEGLCINARLITYRWSGREKIGSGLEVIRSRATAAMPCERPVLGAVSVNGVPSSGVSISADCAPYGY